MVVAKVISLAMLDSERRCDAEHITAPVLITKDYQYGRDVIDFTQYGTSKSLNERNKGFPVLRLNEFESMFIQFPEKHCDLISESTYRQLRLRKGDVLTCRTNGNPHLVGRTAVVMEDTDCAYASYVFKIRANTKILPEVLAVYLNGKYGRSEIERHQMISIQTNFSPERFKRCRVPCLSSAFQETICRMVNEAYVCLKQSTALYADAEEHLLRALGLNGFMPPDPKVSVKGLAESFRSTGRIDAEYYQRKYEETEKALNTLHTVKKLCRIHDSVFVPRKGNYKYIELADIGTSGNIIGCTVAAFDELPSRARRRVKRRQVIVSSIEGSLASCALITDDYHDAICSTGFYVVDSSEINPETLLVLFKSAPMQTLMKKRCSGTILTAMSKSAFEEMPLPPVATDAQQRIAAQVRRSFELRQKSERMLEAAKQAVEVAIESGEPDAANWIRTINVNR